MILYPRLIVLLVSVYLIRHLQCKITLHKTRQITWFGNIENYTHTSFPSCLKISWILINEFLIHFFLLEKYGIGLENIKNISKCEHLINFSSTFSTAKHYIVKNIISKNFRSTFSSIGISEYIRKYPSWNISHRYTKLNNVRPNFSPLTYSTLFILYLHTWCNKLLKTNQLALITTNVRPKKQHRSLEPLGTMGGPIEGTTETLGPSKHYRVGGFEGGPQMGPIMPRDASFSANRYTFFAVRCRYNQLKCMRYLFDVYMYIIYMRYLFGNCNATRLYVLILEQSRK